MIIFFVALQGYIHIPYINIVDADFDLSVFTMITLYRGISKIHNWVILNYKFTYRRLVVVLFTFVYFYYVQNNYVYIKYTEMIK